MVRGVGLVEEVVLEPALLAGLLVGGVMDVEDGCRMGWGDIAGRAWTVFEDRSDETFVLGGAFVGSGANVGRGF